MANKKTRGIFERPTGSGIWWARYADQYGLLHREKCGAKSLAVAVYRQRKTAIREGRFFPEQVNQRSRLFDEVVKDWLEYAAAKRSADMDRTRSRRLLAAFGGKPVDTITPQEIERLKASLKAEGLAEATVNRHLALLKSMLNLAIRNEKLERNPAKAVKLFRENNARVRYLSEEEEFRLFQTLPERYAPVVEVGLLTGLRASNLLGLRWRDMDLDKSVYTIPRSKSGEALRLPMHPRVQEILKSLPRNGIYVFAEADGEPPWDFTHTFASAAKKAGISDLHLHDLRHTFASRLAMAGVDLLTIKELGGWKTLTMVTRYAHLSPDHKRQALGRLISERTGTRTSTSENAPFEGHKGEVDNLLKMLVPGAGVEPA